MLHIVYKKLLNVVKEVSYITETLNWSDQLKYIQNCTEAK